MPKFLPVALFIFAAGAAAQQAKPPASGQQEQLDKDEQVRIRAERAAGGLGKITPEEKAGADLGEGPHKERRQGAARREPKQEKPGDG